MRVSQLLNPTLREVPGEAEVVSHQLMLRAGFIRKSAAGIYTYLPLGLKVLKKIEQIVREEMDAKGGQEVLLPIMQPSELWKETGRWSVYGAEMFRLKDRHDREFCLGPTHEEIVTDLVRNEVRSYKQLPLLLYQIQNKYRDERRPRFGLLRGREFIMKDLYSFDRSPEAVKVSYQKMYDAYGRIFTRCGLEHRPVEADAGAIGGSGGTHEFMVLADSGEAAVVYCPDCDYAANTEKAECTPQPVDSRAGEAEERRLVETPHMKTIEQVSEYLKLDKHQLIKSLLYQADDQLVLVLVRGDREVNEIKLNNLLGGVLDLKLASQDKVEQVLGCEPGFVGPVGVPSDLKVLADHEVALIKGAACGANQKDAHWVGVVSGRDFNLEQTYDLRLIEAGEPCPKCGKSLQEARGIEVGQVFNLGTKYSKALGATFLDEKGEEQLCHMGCYGIGVSRTMAATIEQYHDDDGIIWPMSIAPYHCIIVPVSLKDEAVVKAAEDLYRDLKAQGVEVVLDDRDERPGVKFKDADLIGYPIRLTIGSKTLAEAKLELRTRLDGQTELIPLDQAVETVWAKINASIADLK